MTIDAIKWLEQHIATLHLIEEALKQEGIVLGPLSPSNAPYLNFDSKKLPAPQDPSKAHSLILWCSQFNDLTLTNCLLIQHEPTWNGVVVESRLSAEMVETWRLRCYHDTLGKSQGRVVPIPPHMQEVFLLTQMDSRDLTQEQGLEMVRSVARFFLQVGSTPASAA